MWSYALFNRVSRINPGSWMDHFSNMIGYQGKFFQALCGVLKESHWNYQGINILACYKDRFILHIRIGTDGGPPP